MGGNEILQQKENEMSDLQVCFYLVYTMASTVRVKYGFPFSVPLSFC